MATVDLLTCSNCPATILEADAKAAGWRFWSDGAGELLPFCQKCAVREFASDAPSSLEVPENAPPLIRFIDVDYYGPLRASWRWLRSWGGR